MAKKTPKKLRPFTRGMIIAYIGNGKGKTTAAVGVAVRARGYDKRVLFYQFFKSPEWPSGERVALQKLGVDVVVAGKGFVGILGDKKPKQEHKAAAWAALLEAEHLVTKGNYDLVVLDELISCVEVGLLSQRDVISFITEVSHFAKTKNTHIVLTGHTKYPRIVAHCDLVTDMRMVKHPYYKGYIALKGIDF